MTELSAVTPTLYGAHEPLEIVARAAAQAQVLADVIRSRRLAVNIAGKEYVRVEGWTLLGALLGVSPVCEWTRPVSAPAAGWEARVVARTLDGREVGAAEAICARDEPRWADQPEFALRSMAQTRATAKALRLPLGFVMALAGYETTPAEEIEDVTGPGPVCPDHGRAMALRPAGVSKKTGKPYPPFYICPAQGCRQTVWQRDWKPEPVAEDGLEG
ncbi:MAG: hypothetical protein QN190_14120 [Armatimonadota bacterium]|nr:hypothetical protein [Armatimonadota bacterium]